MNEYQIIDIWIGLKEYFDKKQLDIIASKYIDILADTGVDDNTLKHVIGTDDELDHAISYYLDDASDDEDEIDYESEDYDFDED
jgi:hypothetical protein